MTLSTSCSHASCSSDDASDRSASLAPLARGALQLHHAIPTSVKGAPAHLRGAIRKRQNSESAKRSRLRRKQASLMFHEQFDMQCRRIHMLEARVQALHDMLESRRKQRMRSAGARSPGARGALDALARPQSLTTWYATQNAASRVDSLDALGALDARAGGGGGSGGAGGGGVVLGGGGGDSGDELLRDHMARDRRGEAQLWSALDFDDAASAVHRSDALDDVFSLDSVATWLPSAAPWS